MKSLLQDYYKFQKIANRHMNQYDNNDVIDISTEWFLAPTTILPLLSYSNIMEIKKIITHSHTIDYVKRILNKEQTSTTTPYVKLPYKKEDMAKSKVVQNMVENMWLEYGGYATLFHVLNELTGNIYDHTPFEENLANFGRCYAQLYPNKQFVDICVMDDGISIPQKFEDYGFSFDNECHAISKAINQTSTEYKKDKTRGVGLWSTIKLVTKCNHGSALIVSGKGCLHMEGSKDNNDKHQYILLDNENVFTGTLISLRLRKNQIQHFHDNIEISDLKLFEYNGDYDVE